MRTNVKATAVFAIAMMTAGSAAAQSRLLESAVTTTKSADGESLEVTTSATRRHPAGRVPRNGARQVRSASGKSRSCVDREPAWSRR
jgi:hypothetical protein